MAENGSENWVMPEAEFRNSAGESLGSSEPGIQKADIAIDEEPVADVVSQRNSINALPKTVDTGYQPRSRRYIVSIILVILSLVALLAALYILPAYLASETGNF